MDSVAQRLLQRINAQTWPWVRGVPDEPQAGSLTWEVPHAEIVTAEDKREASFIASQTLHYLRSALDHLIYNASWLDQGAPQEKTQFPILGDRNKWCTQKTIMDLGNMSPKHISWIEAVQPFNNVEWTKTLQALSNADKHRFGVEVSPTVQLGVNVSEAIDDSRSPGVKLAQIERISLRLFLPTLKPYGEIPRTFDEMFIGAASVINPFLEEAGIQTIEVSPAHATASDS
ncbi:hypothetical protein ACQPZA_24085 [Pseudonocardia xinjiangensis]|uniref:hypothetical protein n=1 Tax=Pseudonocardia xinjiangensis TaxID=75289 RepID=UPI003D8BACB8